MVLLADDSLFWTDGSWGGIVLEGSWGDIVRDGSCTVPDIITSKRRNSRTQIIRTLKPSMLIDVTSISNKTLM